jgi:hypothetical protein
VCATVALMRATVQGAIVTHKLFAHNNQIQRSAKGIRGEKIWHVVGG